MKKNKYASFSVIQYPYAAFTLQCIEGLIIATALQLSSISHNIFHTLLIHYSYTIYAFAMPLLYTNRLLACWLVVFGAFLPFWYWFLLYIFGLCFIFLYIRRAFVRILVCFVFWVDCSGGLMHLMGIYIAGFWKKWIRVYCFLALNPFLTG